MKSRTKLFALLLSLCLGCSLLFSNTGTAQDFEADASCRQKSNLAITDILTLAGYFRQSDNAVIVGADLNTSRHTMVSSSINGCDDDKFKAISTVNVCYIEQTSSTRWYVRQCDCNGSSVVEIKVRFEQDYYNNGGFYDPRKKTFSVIIDPASQPGGFCL